MSQYKKLQFEENDASEGTDVNKTSASKECELCHYWVFKDVGFKFFINDSLFFKKYSYIESYFQMYFDRYQ